MSGTVAVSAFGGPIRPKPPGPSQLSAPKVQISASTSPVSVSSRSESVRRKSSISNAITSSASPSNGSTPRLVAPWYSSSITASDTLRTLSGPSAASARSLIASCASSTASSRVSRRRMVATVTGVPSVSIPVVMSSAVRAGWSSGVARTCSSAVSICDCVTVSKSATRRRGFISNVGAATASTDGRSSPTPGLLTMRPSKPSIWASPSGVNASPRKTSVTTTTSESPKRVSISSNALATPLSRGRKASFSATGARCATPAANTSVTIEMTASVTHGRTVTSQLSQSSTLLMAHHSPGLSGSGGSGQDMRSA